MALEINNGISIVICCYNSSKRLPETIKHLALQEVPVIPWEVIIVNNNSKDNTTTVAKENLEKYQILVDRSFIIDEKCPGLTHARKTGVNAANYDIIIFCDDDNWLDKNYIKNAYEIFKKNNKLGIIGAGNAYGAFDKKPQKWFTDHQHFCAIYEGNTQDNVGYHCDEKYMVYGAGMAIQKKLALDYFTSLGNNIITDRTEEKLLSGGDTDMNHYALRAGYSIGKFVSLHFKHYMPEERLNKQYLKKLAFTLSYSHVLVALKNNIPLQKWSRLGLLKYLLITFITRGFFHCSIILEQNKGFTAAIRATQS